MTTTTHTAGLAVNELAVEMLRRGGRLRIKARGTSMMPFIRDGDIVVVATAETTDIAVGDVICYDASPRSIVLHRVIARAGDRFVAKGDALGSRELVPFPQLLGKAIGLERQGTVRRLDTRVARWRNRTIAAVSPLLPALLFLALRLRRVCGRRSGG